MSMQLPSPEKLAALAREDRHNGMLAGTIFLTVIASIAVILRLYAQWLAKGRLWYDAYAIIIGWLLALGCSISACIEFRYAAGQHLVTILTTKPHPLHDILIFLKAGYALTILWGQALFWVKLSLLLFYQRIFAVGKSRFQWAIWILMGYLVCVAIITLFDEIFQCLPVSYFWDVGYAFVGQPIPIKGKCSALVGRGIAMAVLNLVSDVLILLLPLFGLKNLQVAFGRKVALASVFTLGTLCVVVTIVRIPYLRSSELSVDPPWDNAIPIILTAIEPNGGVLCACLPCLPPLLKARKKSSYYDAVYTKATKLTSSAGLSGRKKQIAHDSFDDEGSRDNLKPQPYVPLDDWESRRVMPPPLAKTRDIV